MTDAVSAQSIPRQSRRTTMPLCSFPMSSDRISGRRCRPIGRRRAWRRSRRSWRIDAHIRRGYHAYARKRSSLMPILSLTLPGGNRSRPRSPDAILHRYRCSAMKRRRAQIVCHKPIRHWPPSTGHLAVANRSAEGEALAKP